MPDYNKGCIYKIKHQLDYNDENIYIGSTCNFIRRRCQHKSASSNPNDEKNNNNQLYQYIRENGGWEQFIMVELHKFPCKDKSELSAEERRVIDELKSKLNFSIPGRTQKEWYEDNKEKRLEYAKNYRENNKEKMTEYLKEYYEVNKEKLTEQMKEYRINNKEKNVKVSCDKCGCNVSRKDGLTRHKKSQKCINFKPE